MHKGIGYFSVSGGFENPSDILWTWRRLISWQGGTLLLALSQGLETLCSLQSMHALSADKSPTSLTTVANLYRQNLLARYRISVNEICYDITGLLEDAIPSRGILSLVTKAEGLPEILTRSPVLIGPAKPLDSTACPSLLVRISSHVAAYSHSLKRRAQISI